MSLLRTLRDHWRRHPPVHKIVAAFAGYEPPKDPDADDDVPGGMLTLLFPSGMISVRPNG